MSFFYQMGWQLCSASFNTFFRIEAFGQEKVPMSGPFLLAANHVSYLDPPAVGVSFPRPIHYFARNTLFRGPFSYILPRVNAVPVDNQGDGDLGAIRTAMKVLNRGDGLLVFPEGTRSYDGNFMEPKRGIGLLACRAGVPVIPARIYGTRKALGRGQIFPRWHQPIQVCFGNPLLAEDYDPGGRGKQRFDQAAKRIMKAIIEIPSGHPQLVNG